MDGQIPVWLTSSGVALLLLGLWAYSRWIRNIALAGGKVDATRIGSAEFAVALMLVTWFAVVILQSLHAPRRALEQKGIISASLFFAAVVAFLALFLHLRHLSPSSFLGLYLLPPLKAGALAMRMLIPALPLVLAASLLTQVLLGPRAESQEIVEFFVQAIEANNYRSLLLVAGLGVVVAPVAEEFIFRGFLYPVFKRFLGIPLALVLTAALFAAIHANAGSLGALFVLAMAFTLAYETSGSILVPMLMHALFNFASLTLLYIGASLK